MKTSKNNKHRGELLEAAVKQSDLKIKQITDRVGVSRSTYYNHIADPGLPIDVLVKYGKVLRVDFSTEVPEVGKYSFTDEIVPRKQPKTFDEAIEDRDYWRDKYIALLEKYNRIIEGKQ